MAGNRGGGSDREGSGAATAPGPSVDRWLAACRGAVEAQRAVFAEHAGIEARTHYDGVGEGGDRTLVIDRLCEDAVFSELEHLHSAGHDFTAIAEERGEVVFGEGESPLRVVIDPIDGSVNARRTLPAHCLSFAVASGPSMADVDFGYIYEFGAGEEMVAVRGEGATLGGQRVTTPGGDGLELISLEAPKPERVVKVAERLIGHAYRLRAPGAIAISVTYVGLGRYDGMLTTRPSRSVDAAAAQLIAREAGATVAFAGMELEQAPLDLAARYHLAAARTGSDLEVLLGAQEALI